jgi:hypothetical protein
MERTASKIGADHTTTTNGRQFTHPHGPRKRQTDVRALLTPTDWNLIELPTAQC